MTASSTNLTAIFLAAMTLVAFAGCGSDASTTAPRLFEGPPGPERISIANRASCAIDDWGAIHCWGQQRAIEQPVVVSKPEAGQFVQISVSDEHACALSIEGQVTCWGNSNGGKTKAPEGSGYRSVSAGGVDTCVVDGEGALSCFGQTDRLEDYPTGDFVQVTVGSGVACAREMDGAVTCWGGRSDPIDWQAPDDAMTQIGIGGGTWACGLTVDGTAKCWGPQNGTPKAPDGEWSQIAVGSFVVLQRDDGSLRVFSSALSEAWPPPRDDFVAIAASKGDSGTEHGCGFLSDGQVLCWGDDSAGQVSGVPPVFTGGVPSTGYVVPKPPIRCQVDMPSHECFTYTPLTAAVFDTDRSEVRFETITELNELYDDRIDLRLPVVECGSEGGTFTLRGRDDEGTEYGFAISERYAGPGVYATESGDGLEVWLTDGETTVTNGPETACEVCVDDTGRAGLVRCEALGESGKTALPHGVFRCD